MKKETIRVLGMACGHCEIAVQDAIRRLPGIKKAKARRRKEQAVVEYDASAVSLEEIIFAVNAIGYTAEKIQ